jgi:flagella basal body P-ring formation protein FlgA
MSMGKETSKSARTFSVGSNRCGTVAGLAPAASAAGVAGVAVLAGPAGFAAVPAPGAAAGGDVVPGAGAAAGGVAAGAGVLAGAALEAGAPAVVPVVVGRAGSAACDAFANHAAPASAQQAATAALARRASSPPIAVRSTLIVYSAYRAIRKPRFGRPVVP